MGSIGRENKPTELQQCLHAKIKGQIMTKEFAIKHYFSLLDIGKVEDAVAMFELDGQINTSSCEGEDPLTFITELVTSAYDRCHTILDILIGENGVSAAAHFQYASKSESDDNPTYEGIDYFTFDASGKFRSLSIYCDARPSRR